MKEKEESEKAGLKLNIQKTKSMASSPITFWQWGNNGNSDRQFSWAPKSLQMVPAAMKLKDACSLEEKPFLVAQTVKHLSTMQETWVRSLGREDSLEKEMAIYSSTIAWKIPWTERSLVGYSPRGCKESDTIERFHFTSLQFRQNIKKQRH